MKRICIIFSFLILSICLCRISQADKLKEYYLKGQEAYDKGRYKEAIRYWEHNNTATLLFAPSQSCNRKYFERKLRKLRDDYF